MNQYSPHVYVLPEDDANRQLANGFYLDPKLDSRRMQIDRVAGGWLKVLEHFQKNHQPVMERNSQRYLVLLIDFDERDDRLDTVSAAIPDHLRERVFVLGTWSEPEKLRQALGCSYENIGQTLARECRDGARLTWGHELLRHNASELDRLQKNVRPILFPGLEYS